MGPIVADPKTCPDCAKARAGFIENMKRKGVDVEHQFVQDTADKVVCQKHDSFGVDGA